MNRVLGKFESTSVGGKLIAIFSIVWVLFLTLILTEFWMIEVNANRMGALYSRQLSTLFKAQEAQIDVLSIVKYFQEIAEIHDVDRQQLLVAHVSDALTSLQQHVDELHGSDSYTQHMAKVVSDVKWFEELVIMLSGAYEDKVKAKDILSRHDSEVVIGTLNEDLLTLVSMSRHDAELGYKSMQIESEKYTRLKTMIAIMALMMLSFVSWLVSIAIRRPLQSLLQAVSKVSAGHLGEQLPYLDMPNEVGKLASSIHVLQKIALEVSASSAMNARINKLAKVFQAAESVPELCLIYLQQMLDLAGGQFGLVYLADAGRQDFVLCAKSGISDTDAVVERFRPGSGLLGNCVLQHRAEVLRDIETQGVRVSSGFSQIDPRVVAIFPLSNRTESESVLGVLEIGSIHELKPDFAELLARSLPFFFTKLELLEKAAEAEQMILTLQEQSRELAAQEETLRLQKFELMEKQAVLSEANANLELARQEAEQSAAVKGQFLANMSHEIRTPMNAIIGMTRLALGHETDLRQKGYLKKIDAASQGLLKLINDILDFSKIDAERLTMENIPFRLADVTNNITTILQDGAQCKGLEFLVEVDPEVPDCMSGDPARLGQVLINVLGNAIKFTETGEVMLHIALGKRARKRIELRFTVRDTGIGMSAEQMAQLFMPFVQADATVTRRFGGSGLGLSITKRLVELMGGEVTVTSELGWGATFNISVWFDESPVAAETACSAVPFEGKRILVVDDNQNASRILAELLQRWGARVATGYSVAQCCQSLQEADGGDPYDWVFLDAGLLEGARPVDLASLCPALALQKRPGIVLLTVGDTTPYAELVREGTVQACLDKPVTRATLCDALAGLAAGMPAGQAGMVQSPQLYDELRGLQVLVAEDNTINQQIVAELLDAVGVRVTLVSNGKEAVDTLLAAGMPLPWSMVLMDVQMPVMDGYEATTLIRRQPQLAELPIVALTAHAMSSDHQKSLAMGMQAHLTKPLDPTELYGCLLRFALSKEDMPSGGSPFASAEDGSGLCPALHAVPGLDVRAGLRHTGGNARLYQSVVRQFLQYEHIAQQVRTCLDAAEVRSAIREVHTLKGIAANIGAEEMARLCGEIEQALSGNGGPDDIAPMLAELEAGMGALVAGVRIALGGPEHSPVGGHQRILHGAEAMQLLQRLAFLLDSNDAEAIQLCEDERASLMEMLGAGYPAFADALHDFDLAHASSLLHKVIHADREMA